ncbi:MAG: hypothetical protein FWF23_00990 [Alphaproteobacteria bacterium]|nr:hypothetical protein [Alphaproteobacteria bacterium]MCL2504663.1 hypothetical protein [Alphaproteobacteria bacterium]
MSVDIQAVNNIISETADKIIMPVFNRGLEKKDIMTKGGGEFVTEADINAEKELSSRLKDMIPGSSVVGEEGYAKNARIIDALYRSGHVWIIDPIDGTRAFTEGRKEFATMVSLVKNGETIAGWIYDPNTKKMLMGEQGSGVLLSDRLGSNHKMTLAPNDVKLGIVGSRLKGVLRMQRLVYVVASLPPLALGTAVAFDYGRFFCGDNIFGNTSLPRASFLLYYEAKTWDHRAGLFFVKEAGGYSGTFAKTAYNDKNFKGGLIVARNKEEWEEIHSIIKPAIDSFFKDIDSRAKGWRYR